MFTHAISRTILSTSARTALLVSALAFAAAGDSPVGFAQDVASAAPVAAPERVGSPEPTDDAKRSAGEAPLTERERQLLRTIEALEERVTKLEAQMTKASPAAVTGVAATAPPTPTASAGPSPDAAVPDASTTGAPPAVEPVASVTPAPSSGAASSQDDSHWYGGYTPNFGFKLADTEHGDLSVSIYTYARYLNARGLNENYTDALGNLKSVQQRQDVQLQKVQIKFLGWIFDPKLRYFVYAWTSNANQGQSAQVVLAGNLNYTFNKYITLSAGITSLPSTMSTEGNFPFWLTPDSRHIADEFFRASYTSGIWARGNITKRLRYQAMIGNNMSTLGVSAARLDPGFNTFAGALVWTPLSDDYTAGFGDFEQSDRLKLRLGTHFMRSNENKESQPQADAFENTQLRLSDGTVIFTPNLFGPGVTVTDARVRMSASDFGIKYHGYALEGEYYLRWIDDFQGVKADNVATLFNHGFQLQGSAMVVPKSVQLYLGTSRVNGDYGDGWDFRTGVNVFPYKNRVVRWNNEFLYTHASPVGYTSVPYAVGGTGPIFHSTIELAF
jgi:hypothetical protein